MCWSVPSPGAVIRVDLETIIAHNKSEQPCKKQTRCAQLLRSSDLVRALRCTLAQPGPPPKEVVVKVEGQDARPRG